MHINKIDSDVWISDRNLTNEKFTLVRCEVNCRIESVQIGSENTMAYAVTVSHTMKTFHHRQE